MKDISNIIIFGETFWDQYEDGSMFVGGAGLNVAWNLAGLGCSSFFVSRVGEDPLGKKMIQELSEWGISTKYIQKDSKRPTGTLQVKLDSNKKPTFIAPKEVAFDHLEYERGFDSFSPGSMVYFGSFILRSEFSRLAIKKIRDKGFPIFMDLNLRPPFWNREVLDEWVRDIEIFKLSDEDATYLFDQSKLSVDQQVKKLQSFMVDRNIQNTFFTLGDKGSYWIQNDRSYFVRSEIIDAVDTVGAGDAFCAGILLSRELNLTYKDSIEKASRFAAEICKVEGATSHDKSFYLKCKKEIWNV